MSLLMDVATNPHANKPKWDRTQYYPGLTANDFQRWTEERRTDGSQGLTYDVVAAVGEAGECLGAWKEYERRAITKEEYREKLLLEMGDTIHYFARICSDLGITLQDVIDANVEKLSNRVKYGKGNLGTRS